MSQQQSYSIVTSSKDQIIKDKQGEGQDSSSDDKQQIIDRIIQQYKEVAKTQSQVQTPSSFNSTTNNTSSQKSEDNSSKGELQNKEQPSEGDQSNKSIADQKTNANVLPPMIPKLQKLSDQPSQTQPQQNNQISQATVSNVRNSLSRWNENSQTLAGIEPYEPYRRPAHQRQSSMMNLTGINQQNSSTSLANKGSETATNNNSIANGNNSQQQIGLKQSLKIGDNSIKQLVENRLETIKKQQELNRLENSQFKKEFISQIISQTGPGTNSSEAPNNLSNRGSFDSALTPTQPYEPYYNKQSMRNSKKLDNTLESRQNKGNESSVNQGKLQDDINIRRLMTSSQFNLEIQKYKNSLMNNLNLDSTSKNLSEKKKDSNFTDSPSILADSVINLTDSITGNDKLNEQNQSQKIQQDSFSDRLLNFQYTSKIAPNQFQNNSFTIDSPDTSVKNGIVQQQKLQTGALTAGTTPTNNQQQTLKNSIFSIQYQNQLQNASKPPTSQFQPVKQNPIDLYKYDFTQKNILAAQNKIHTFPSGEFSENNLQKIKAKLESNISSDIGLNYKEITSSKNKNSSNGNSNNNSNTDYSQFDLQMIGNTKRNRYGQDKQRSNTIAANYPLPTEKEMLNFEQNQDNIKFSFNGQSTTNQSNEVPFNFANKITFETNQQKQNLLDEKNANKVNNQAELNKWFYNQINQNYFVPSSIIGQNGISKISSTPDNPNINLSNTNKNNSSIVNTSNNDNSNIQNISNNQITPPIISNQDKGNKDNSLLKNTFKGILSAGINAYSTSAANTTTAAMSSTNNTSKEIKQSNHDIQNRSFRSSSNFAQTSTKDFSVSDYVNSKLITSNLKVATQNQSVEDQTDKTNRENINNTNKDENIMTNSSNLPKGQHNIMNSVELFKRDLKMQERLPSTQYLDELLGRNNTDSHKGSSNSKLSSFSPVPKNYALQNSQVEQLLAKEAQKREEQDNKNNNFNLYQTSSERQSVEISAPRKSSLFAESKNDVKYLFKSTNENPQQNYGQKIKNELNQHVINHVKNELAFQSHSSDQISQYIKKLTEQKPPLPETNKSSENAVKPGLNLNKSEQTILKQNSFFQEIEKDIKESFGVMPQTQQANKNANNQSFSIASIPSDQNQNSTSLMGQSTNQNIGDQKSIVLSQNKQNEFQSNITSAHQMIEKNVTENNYDSSSQSSESNINVNDLDNSSKPLQRKQNKAATSINYNSTAFKNVNYLLNSSQNTPNYFSNPFSIDQLSSTSANKFVSPKFEGADSDARPLPTPTPPFSSNISHNVQSYNLDSTKQFSTNVSPFDNIATDDILKTKDLLEQNAKILQQAYHAFSIPKNDQQLNDNGSNFDDKISQIMQSNQKRAKQNEQMVKQNQELNDKIQKTLYGLDHESSSLQKTLLLQERQTKKSIIETTEFNSSINPQKSNSSQQNVTQIHQHQSIDYTNFNKQATDNLFKGSPDKYLPKIDMISNEKRTHSCQFLQSHSANTSPMNVNVNELLKPITPLPSSSTMSRDKVDEVIQKKSDKKSSKNSSSHHIKYNKGEKEKSQFFNSSQKKQQQSPQGEDNGDGSNSNNFSSSQSSTSQLNQNKSGNNIDNNFSQRAEGSFTSSSSSNTVNTNSYEFSSSHSPIMIKRQLQPDTNQIFAGDSKQNLIVTQKVQYQKSYTPLASNQNKEATFSSSNHTLQSTEMTSSGNNISNILKNVEGSGGVVTVQVQVKQMPFPTKFFKRYNPPNPRSDSIFFDNFFKKENFKMGKHLGTGKFSEVSMAQDIKTGFIVAIKKIKKEVLIKYKSEDYLENEIKIQIYSNHPNILKLYGFYYDEEYVYLVQEYASHGELYHELKKQSDQRFDEVKGAAYMRQICDAFTYLHRSHIIHRDIKPENILMSYGVLKIADFGCSVYCPEDRRDTFCGTIDYISPEIVNGEVYGQSVDIWSLGILTFELLTGKSPFQYETKNEILVNILNVNVNIPDYLSEDAQDFIKKLLVRDPSQRMTMDQVINHKWIVTNLQKYSQDWDSDLAQKFKILVQ